MSGKRYTEESKAEAVGLTQTEAGVPVHSALRSWPQWEAGERRMHPAMWELFLIKTDQTPDH